MTKIGVFGGTFDPVHLGHLIAVEAARDVLGLDEVRLIPAGRPPHRDVSGISPDADRLMMACLAIEGYAGLTVDDREMQNGSSPYTIDTLLSIADENPLADITLLIGRDWVESFGTWVRSEEILNKFQVAVLCRPMENGPQSTYSHPSFRYLNTPPIGISSTDIRRRVRDGRSIRFLVPKPVEDYIYKKGLYRNTVT